MKRSGGVREHFPLFITPRHYFVMELDSEVILMEVQKFPCLYDIRLRDYKNRELKRDCWIAVSKAVVSEEKWEELDESSKTNIGKYCL